MILTVSTTHRPATDLGFLLHKNPDRHQAVTLSFGTAHVLYPDADEERCTVALVVDVDAIDLVRRRHRPSEFSLAQYVNDRPYVASSFMSVALGKVFSTAMSGRSKERPELVERRLPLEAHLPVVPCRGGPGLLRSLLEPLGYVVEATAIPLDSELPSWGDSSYLDVRIEGTQTLKDLLEHLFVLLPVLDDEKHYWVGADEVSKLLHRGGVWLPTHPERELITNRYLRHDIRLTSEAMARLTEDDITDPDESAEAHDAEEEAVERPISLATQRIAAVVEAMTRTGARRVLDLGCGQGRLIQALLASTGVDQVVGVDVSHRALAVAARRLHLDSMGPRQRQRIELWQGSLTYRDRRLQGFDAAALVEVVEHLDPDRLGSFERVVFGHASPRLVVLTTPNVEYNVRFENLPAGALRHRDHRFEWTRAELECWCAGVAERNGYQVQFSGVGPADPDLGTPTQMAVFTR